MSSQADPRAQMITRYGKAVAKEGKGEELARLLVESADAAAQEPGCLQYHVNRAAGEPDTIWVTEMWKDQDSLDASLEKAKESGEIKRAMPLIESMEMVELEPVGGLAGRAGMTPKPGFEIRNLLDCKDSAPEFGFGEIGEARFASDQFDSTQSGFALHRLKPGKRHAFGHHHELAEEVYVVIAGSGRVRLGDEIREVGRLDAIRVAPEVIRAFEAGEDGMEILVFGQRFAGDGGLDHGWWTD